MSQGEPEEAPGKAPLDQRSSRTVKRRKNPPNRVEKPCGFEVAGFRMVDWPASVSRERVKWERSAKEYPPRQKADTFNLDAVMKSLMEGAGSK